MAEQFVLDCIRFWRGQRKDPKSLYTLRFIFILFTQCNSRSFGILESSLSRHMDLQHYKLISIFLWSVIPSHQLTPKQGQGDEKMRTWRDKGRQSLKCCLSLEVVCFVHHKEKFIFTFWRVSVFIFVSSLQISLCSTLDESFSPGVSLDCPIHSCRWGSPIFKWTVLCWPQTGECWWGWVWPRCELPPVPYPDIYSLNSSHLLPNSCALPPHRPPSPPSSSSTLSWNCPSQSSKPLDPGSCSGCSE